VLRDAVAAVSGPGAILNVADLAAPSVVEAVLSRNAHQFATAGVEFVVWGSEAPKDGTLRDLYKGPGAGGGVVHGKNSPTPGEVVPCPGRDLQIFKGDWTSMIGPKDEMEARGISVPPSTATRSGHSRVRRVIDAVRAMREDANPLLFPSAIFTLVLIFGCDNHGALQLRQPTDVMARCAVLHLRDDHQRRLRRLQFCGTVRCAAVVRYRTDVRWR